MPKDVGATIVVADLVGVIYSSGKVFDGLSTGRLDTEDFLRTGSTAGVTSRADLALLQDLRDAAKLTISHARDRLPIDAAFVMAVNGQMSRSAAIHPGELRTAAQRIGVSTPHGRHEPPPVTEHDLQRLVDAAIRGDDPTEDALELFVQLAKAQPFMDGNKRTAILVANGLLLRERAGVVLTVPVDDDDARVAAEFNDLLARAYVHDEHEALKSMLRSQGLRRLA